MSSHAMPQYVTVAELGSTEGDDRLRAVLAELPPQPLLAVGGTALSAKPIAVLKRLCRLGIGPVDLLSYASGLDAELLLAHERLGTLRSAFVSLEQFGLLPSRKEIPASRIVPETFGSVIWGLEAQARGVTFLPGPDQSSTGVGRHRPLSTVTCPFTGVVYTAWPALAPDLGLIHALTVTAEGFVLIERDVGVDRLLAKACRRLVVSVERRPEEIDDLTGLQLIAPSVDPVVVHAPRGAWPGSFSSYEADAQAIREYTSLRSRDERRAWWSR